MSKEIQDLVIKWKQTKDESILNVIAKEFRPKIESLAVKISPSNTEDLTQHGLSYLTYYLEKYDTSRKIMFTTFYLSNVKGRMRHYMRDYGRVIRIARYTQEYIKAYYMAQAKHQALHGKPMTIEEYAYLHNCDPIELRKKIQKYEAASNPSPMMFSDDICVDTESYKELEAILKKVDAYTFVQELVTHYETHNSLEMYFDTPEKSARAERLLRKYLEKPI